MEVLQSPQQLLALLRKNSVASVAEQLNVSVYRLRKQLHTFHIVYKNKQWSQQMEQSDQMLTEEEFAFFTTPFTSTDACVVNEQQIQVDISSHIYNTVYQFCQQQGVAFEHFVEQALLEALEK